MLRAKHVSVYFNTMSYWLGVTYNVSTKHRLSINIPTKRGKEKSPPDRHCQCEKEMDDYLLACQQTLKNRAT
jgi:hypothetical protein